MVARNIRIVVSAVDRFVETLIKKLVLDIVANLQRPGSEGGTPVDTGWARANWIPQIGSPHEGTAGTRASAEAGSLSSAAQSGVASVAATYKLRRGRVYITNNVPYILKLDAGSSNQAPKGFVIRSIRKAVKKDLVQ